MKEARSLVSRITFEPLQDDAVAFLTERTGIDYTIEDFRAPKWVCATAREGNVKVTGVLLGEFTSWFEVHMTTAVDDPRIITRRLLHAIFSTFFSKAVRVTMMCRPDNKKSIRGILHLGARYEGFSRMGIDGRWDGLVFGMLRSECRWIRAPKVPFELRKAA
jgi:hypothetical protein